MATEATPNGEHARVFTTTGFAIGWRNLRTQRVAWLSKVSGQFRTYNPAKAVVYRDRDEAERQHAFCRRFETREEWEVCEMHTVAPPPPSAPTHADSSPEVGQ